jgi:hypothetical protein
MEKELDVSISNLVYYFFIKSITWLRGHVVFQYNLELSKGLAALWGFQPVIPAPVSWEVGSRKNPEVPYGFQHDTKQLPHYQPIAFEMGGGGATNNREIYPFR